MAHILPDKDPYHNRGRDQMRKKGVQNKDENKLEKNKKKMCMYCKINIDCQNKNERPSRGIPTKLEKREKNENREYRNVE
jgi:hypothetical protein